ncbi:helix-turn-helix transcriptional regulator [Paenibacillus alba]|nr:helix-turn-helix transcriptional regulator [Paenibacillus alba]
MKLGERLKELRDKQQWTQNFIADRLAVTKQAISSWERNIASPSIKQLLQLADLFHVSTDYLLGRIDIPLPVTTNGKEESTATLQTFYDLEHFLLTNDHVRLGNFRLSISEKLMTIDVLQRIFLEYNKSKEFDSAGSNIPT